MPIHTHYQRLKSLTLAVMSVAFLACVFPVAANGDSPPQRPDGDQADAKSNVISAEHAEDESPELGVIIGSCPGEGVCVLDTVWGSPADEAGIMHGDYILSLNGTNVSTPKQLMDAMKKTKGGETAKVTVWRHGQTVEREVMLASKSDEPPASHKAWLGVMLRATQGDTAGVMIERVMRGGPAADAGLQDGDVIVRRNDQPIEDMRSFAQSIEDMGPGSELQLTIQRDGNQQQMKVTLGDMDESPMQFRREAMSHMHEGLQSGSAGNESSQMMDETLDDLRQRLRNLERQVREMKSKDDVSSNSATPSVNGTMLVVQRDQDRDRDRARLGSRNSGLQLNNNNYNWQNRYRSGYRMPLSRSPAYGNSYFRYGGNPYYGNSGYGNYGRNYSYGQGGVRIGNFGVWW